MKRFITAAAVIILCFFAAHYFDNKSDTGGKTVISFSSWGSKNEIDIVKTLLSDFEIKHSGIKVNFIHIPQNYFQKLHLLAASGLEPDVIFINNLNIRMYIDAGLLEDLSPYFENAEKDFYKEALECFKHEGRLYAVPRDISNLVIYYNKDIFKKHNVKMPDKIKDIFELRELAEKVNGGGNFGISYEKNPMYWLYYLSSNGGGAVSDDGKKILISAPESIEALNLYADMKNKDKTIPSEADMGSMVSAQMFLSGRLAMYLSGRWITPKIRQSADFDWDVIEFPAAHNVYIDASGWAVSKKSKHKKEAAELIKYLSSTEAQSIAAESGLIIPAHKDAVFQKKGEKPENYKAFKTMLNKSKPSPAGVNYAAVLDAAAEKAEKVLNGSMTAQEVFNDKTAAKLQKLLEE